MKVLFGYKALLRFKDISNIILTHKKEKRLSAQNSLFSFLLIFENMKLI